MFLSDRIVAATVTIHHTEAFGLVVVSVPAQQSLSGLVTKAEPKQVFIITEELNLFSICALQGDETHLKETFTAPRRFSCSQSV